ncbi:MAG: tetratricopeptide repeat protein [Paracoccaceae bacterium]|nr:tetratricopeptide repeat protein [Paracoccaceae bacterium]
MPIQLKRPIFALALAVLLIPGPLMADEDAGAYLAARVAGVESDYQAAAGWFARALIADPTNAALLEGAVISNIGVGNLAAAAAISRQLLQTGANSQAGFIALLADQAKRGDFEGILADAKAGRKIGALLDGLVGAWAELGAGRMSEALSGFDTLAKLRGLEVFGLYHKALALASAGDFEGAEAIFSGPAGDAIHGMRRAIIAHAQVLSQLERNTDGVALLDKIFVPGQDPEIDALRARMAANQPVTFDLAHDATDGIAEVFFTLATALNGEADDGYTLIYSRVATYLRPDHTEALLMSAGLLSQQGQHDLATETYALIPPNSPTYHVAELGRAESLLAAGKAETAIEVLQALARSHGQIIAVQKSLGDALRREDRFEEATTAYDAAIALAEQTPSRMDWILYYSRGICHERQKRWEKAEPDFRRALEQAPDQPQVLNYLGYSYLEMNINLDEALSLIERAVAADPESGYIIDSLAWGLFRLGRYDEAVEPMEKASLLEPVDPVVTDHLGDIYWAVGRRLEAQFQWRRALSFKPEQKEAVRIRRKLEVGLDDVLAAEGAKPLTALSADEN